LNAVQQPSGCWFVETCSRMHPLVWAKLKGFPFWPAKAVREHNGQIDCRFFGAHDRAWVPTNHVFDLSEDLPAGMKSKKKAAGLDVAMEELNDHINRLRSKSTSFSFAPQQQRFDPVLHFGPSKLSSNTSRLSLGENRSSPLRDVSPQPAKLSFEDTFGIKKMSTGSKRQKEDSDQYFGTKQSQIISADHGTNSKEILPSGVFEGSNPPLEPNAPSGKSEKLILPLGKLMTEKKKLKEDAAVKLQQKLKMTEVDDEEDDEEEDDVTVASTLDKTANEENENCQGGVDKRHDNLSKMIAMAKDRGIQPCEKGEDSKIELQPTTTCDEEEEERSSGSSASHAEDEELIINTGRRVDIRKKRASRRRSSSSSDNDEPQTKSKRVRNAHPNTLHGGRVEALTARVVDAMRASIADLVAEAVSNVVSSNDGLGIDESKSVKLDTPVNSDLKAQESIQEAIMEYQWCHKQEMLELRHNMELTMAEWQAVWDLDRMREIDDMRKKADEEKKICIDETKKKQWCSNCFKEAIFYCCWNTSYCDYPCQQAHWPNHMATCAQGPNANKIKKEEEKMNDANTEVQVIGHRQRDLPRPNLSNHMTSSAPVNNFVSAPSGRTSMVPQNSAGAFVLRPSASFQPINASPTDHAIASFSSRN